MADKEYEEICRVIDQLLHSEHTLCIRDESLRYLEELCAQARTLAEQQDYVESHRLVHLARNLLVGEAERLGRGGIQE